LPLRTPHFLNAIIMSPFIDATIMPTAIFQIQQLP
jgi:hypothetical protein